MTGFTPLTSDQDFANVRKTTVLDVMRRLLQPKNMMVKMSHKIVDCHWIMCAGEHWYWEEPEPSRQGLLHLYPQHHPGGGWPHPGLLQHHTIPQNSFMVATGAQESSKDQREKTCKLHPMGTCIYSGWHFMAFHWTLTILTIHAWQVALSRTSPYVSSSHRVSGLMLANHTSISRSFSSFGFNSKADDK